jgi:formate dehydrogenase gamma subunit
MNEADLNQKKNETELENEFVLRWTPAQRFQHMVMLVSFLLLMITGLPLIFPQSEFLNKIFFFAGSFGFRGLVHRIAAVALIILCIYHVCYCLFSEVGHRDLRSMMPRLQDFKDVIALIAYDLGLKAEHPKFDRFNYAEKLEYMSVVWGSAIMILTGLMLWFEGTALAILPKWVWDVALVIHSYEAILAFLAIIIWHFYNVHLNPEVFPMSRVWLDGKISLKQLKQHHPLEFERLMAERERTSKDLPSSKDDH